MLLGGDDIDDLLKDYVVNQVETEYGLDDLGVLVNRMDERLRHRFQGVLREKIEEAKIKLSGANAALVEIFGLLRDEDGDLLDIDVEIDRPTFNRLIGPKIERTIELCHQTLASVNFEPDLIDTYLLVGGSASIPLVFERMQAVFGTDKVRRHNQPMLAVTQGAATFAHRLAETVECIHCGVDIPQEVDPCPECNREQDQKIEVIHTTAHEYVIELKDDPQHVLVRGNDILPVTSAHTFRTVADNQHLIEVKIYNSVNKKPEKVLTAFVGLEQDFPAGTEVVVVFTVDENNEIHLNVDRIGDSGNGFSITEGRGKDDHALLEQVEVEIEKVNRLNLDTDKVTRFESDIKAVLGKINGVIDPKTESVNQEQFDNCQREIGAIEQRAGQRLLSLENVENRYHWIENVYGEILSSELKYELADLWEEANQHRSDPEKLDQIDRQMWQLAMQDSLVGSLIMIEIAARRIESTDPSKAEFLLARHRRIIQAHQSRRYEEAAEILSVTLPETSAILGEERESMGQRPIETRLQR
jgi:molecular chaperone DnaK